MIDRIRAVHQAMPVLTAVFGEDKAKVLYGIMQTVAGDWAQVQFVNSLIETCLTDSRRGFKDILSYKVMPVSIREFVCDPFFLNKADEVYPEVLLELEEMNNGEYVEVVLTGGIGSAKTSSAIYSQAYQVYLLSCLANPHKVFGLDSSHEIVIVFQSLTAKLAKELDYTRFRKLIEGSPYFREYFPFNKEISSKLVFPNRIECIPISGEETGAIGQNVIGGILDEVNFMSIVENSKQSSDGSGTYNQADALYSSIARRRKTRFSNQGSMAGLLCLVSSKRFPNQFTDIKTKEANDEIAATGKSRIYVYDKRVWDVKPKGSFMEEKFPIFIGDESRKPKVLTLEEAAILEDSDDANLVDWIPMDFKSEFDTDIIKSLQDIAGHSTLSRHPFLMNVEAVALCFGKVRSIVKEDWVDFVKQKATILPVLIKNPQFPRFCHLDMSTTGDSTGFVIGHVTGFSKIQRGDYVEYMPNIVIDVAIEVRPPQGGEIIYSKVRELLYMLRKLGMPIKWVTADTYQSTDMLQILRGNGFMTGIQSMDTSTTPYDYLKTALYDGRVGIPTHDLLRRELLTIERDTKKNKIDHPQDSSKDLADALAGVVYGLTIRKEIWTMFDIPMIRIPESIRNQKDKLKEGEAA